MTWLEYQKINGQTHQHSGIFCLMVCKHKAKSKGATNVKFSILLTDLYNQAAIVGCVVLFICICQTVDWLPYLLFDRLNS